MDMAQLDPATEATFPDASRAGARAFFRQLGIATISVALAVALAAIYFRSAGGLTRFVQGADASMALQGDPMIGEQLFTSTCATCHGSDRQGMPEQGVSLRGSAFLMRTPDHALLNFLRIGRPANDRASMTGRVMPAKGGNRQLTDQDLVDIIRFLKNASAVSAVEQ